MDRLKTLRAWIGKAPRATNLKPHVAVALADEGEGATVDLFGPVYESDPVDWLTGEPSSELHISLQSVLDELERVKDARDVTIRLHSCGGDAAAGIAIHNLVRSFAGHVRVEGMGLVASAGSIIFCAGDERIVHPSTILMVHEASCLLFDYYSVVDLERVSRDLQAFNAAMRNIYAAATGKDDGELEEMMHEETYLVGSEIVDAGFAHAIADGEDEEPDEEEAIGAAAPEAARVVADLSATASWLASQQFEVDGRERTAPGNDDGGEEAAREEDDVDVSTLDELRAAYPDLTAELTAQAAGEAMQAERARIREIDEISAGISPELIARAKYESPMTAGEVAIAAIKAAAEADAAERGEALAAMDDDVVTSNIAKVEVDPAVVDEVEAEGRELDAMLASTLAAFNAKAKSKSIVIQKEVM